MVSILDVEYRLYPWFPELSANGEWDIREREMARAVRHASIVIAGSDVVRDQIETFFGVPAARIAVVPFPTPQAAVDASAAVRDPKEEQHIREKYQLDGPFLFYPAQFWAHKNHVNLLHALRLLREQHGLPFSLVLTGSDQGNYAHVQKTMLELGLDNAVRLPGFVPRVDVIAFYRSALALTFVSFHGPENLPVLEAQALSCPAILSNIPGVRELYGDGPVLVNPRDPVSIAAGIKRLNDDPALRQRCIAVGREMAKSYTYEKYIGQIHRLLDDFEPIRRCWP
jgi:glycosyltransferase involved in cell wall biosynthesis